MPTSNLSFAALRRLLLDLDFEEKAESASHIAFEHPPTDTLLLFRAYRPQEKVSVPDLLSVRKQLDERALLVADSFDNLLRKASA